MTTLHNILQQKTSEQHATDAGTRMHKKLRHITIDQTTNTGDCELIKKISTNPNLVRFFAPSAKTEIPIAGTIGNRFVSRRIDRMIINHHTKTLDILDYKTDLNHDAFYKQYIAQITEYTHLLRQIYPTYNICGYILWTHDFSLEKIV